MAPPAGTLRVGRYFLALLAIFVVLYALVFWPGRRHVPKLGLDLEGGTQVVLQAKTPNGQTPSKSSMEEARNIMEQRVNSYGVAEATVVVQGSDEIVISIPGRNASDRLAQIGSAAQLNFRGLVMPVVQPVAAAVAAQSSAAAASSKASTTSGSAAASSGASTSGAASSPSASKASTSVAPQADHVAPLADRLQPLAAAPSSTSAAATSAAATSAAAAATSAAPASAATTSAAAASATPSLSAAATKLLSGTSVVQDPLAVLAGQFAIPTTDTEFAKLTTDQQSLLQAAVQHFDCQSSPPDTKAQQYLLACDSKTNPQAIYLLGPVIVPGTEIDDASAVTDATTGKWSISLSLKSSGQASWAKYTTAHNTGSVDVTNTASVTSCGATTTPCADFVGFTLDGEVISSPVNQQAINGGDTQISGTFTQSSATDLANQLKYGALPLSFNQQTAANVSATLGSGQLKAGLLAGGIGLVLVVIYSLLYYRALGLVTIASLLVSGGLTYASIVFLGRQIDFTLTLAGIAGFIVAVGITADSFVVYFERIKDEVHEGRSMRVATPRAWIRARRTILSADTVSFLAAAVLYYFAAGDVRGFAFTLGLSTILDLVVVFLFTHPLVSLLSRSRAFGSARFTGLDSARDGGVVADDSTAAVKRTARRAAAPEPRVPVGSIRLDKPSGSKASSSVAVADDDSELDHSDDDGLDVAAAEEATPELEAESTTAGVAEVASPAAKRPAAAPQPGSAAERAAARRAKLREQQSGAGSDSKDQS